MRKSDINPEDLKRIVIIGSSCCGKTTLAKSLSSILNSKHIEMDAINWLPEWQQRPTDELREITAREIEAEKWVLDGNYSRARDLFWPRSTLIIWPNYSFPVVFYRAVKRTFRRVFFREELFSGNRETFRNTFLSTDSMIVWVLRTYHSRRRRYEKQIEENSEYNFLVFKKPSEAFEFLRQIKEDLASDPKSPV